MSSVALDASAILAFLFNEQGAEKLTPGIFLSLVVSKTKPSNAVVPVPPSVPPSVVDTPI